MAEDLTDYLLENGFKVRYLHSEVDTLERIEIVRDLRLGEFDVLVGINLLREGLDLPEVTLVAILDADKEGFLRGQTSLIQTIGRAARNVHGTVIMYADNDDRRHARRHRRDRPAPRRQTAYNEEHGITPREHRQGRQRHRHHAEQRGGGAHQGPPRRQGRGAQGRHAAPRPGEAARQPGGRDVRGRGPAQIRVRCQAAGRDQGAQQGALRDGRRRLAEALHLQELVSRARQLGALAAAPLPAAAVVVDEPRAPQVPRAAVLALRPQPHVPAQCHGRRTRRAPCCAATTTSSWCRARSRITQQQVTDTCEGLPYAEAHDQLDGLGALRDSQNDFMALMTALESDAFKIGLPLRRGLQRRRVRAV